MINSAASKGEYDGKTNSNETEQGLHVDSHNDESRK